MFDKRSSRRRTRKKKKFKYIKRPKIEDNNKLKERARKSDGAKQKKKKLKWNGHL